MMAFVNDLYEYKCIISYILSNGQYGYFFGMIFNKCFQKNYHFATSAATFMIYDGPARYEQFFYVHICFIFRGGDGGWINKFAHLTIEQLSNLGYTYTYTLHGAAFLNLKFEARELCTESYENYKNIQELGLEIELCFNEGLSDAI
jgi:hypothetical protein